MKLGACVGTVTPELAQLNLQWAFGVGANSMSDEFKNQSYEFVPLTFEQVPQAWWSKFLLWTNFKHFWMLGNEPCTANDGNKTPAEVARLLADQMKFINDMYAANGLTVAPKFILTLGTQGQAPNNPYNNNVPLIESLLTARSTVDKLIIKRNMYDNIFGFHFHYYPRWRSDNDAVRWDVQEFVNHANGCRDWIETWNSGVFAGKKLWCSELGFEGYFEGDPRPAQYLTAVLPKLNGCLDRFAFYVASGRVGPDGSNNYLPLLDAGGELTDLGNAWSVAV